MTEKKLTDSEIVKIKKRLKDIVEENEFEYFHNNTMSWYSEIRLAYMAIKHLQAENEKLKSAINGFRCYEDKIKSEAVKEFAENIVEKVEKARQKYQRLCKEQGEEEDEAMNIHFRGMINLVKEMVGENNG